jgi:hypothetical protein
LTSDVIVRIMTLLDKEIDVTTKYCVVRFNKNGKPKLTYLQDAGCDQKWTDSEELATHTVEKLSKIFAEKHYQLVAVPCDKIYQPD